MIRLKKIDFQIISILFIKIKWEFKVYKLYFNRYSKDFNYSKK